MIMAMIIITFNKRYMMIIINNHSTRTIEYRLLITSLILHLEMLSLSSLLLLLLLLVLKNTPLNSRL